MRKETPVLVHAAPAPLGFSLTPFPATTAMAAVSAAARSPLLNCYFRNSPLSKSEFAKSYAPYSSSSPPLLGLAAILPVVEGCRASRFSFIAPRCSSSTDVEESKPYRELAVLLEVEGVLLDMYRLGNRQAFNLAFQKLGLDCANWTEPIYVDLLRKSSGDEERMLILFFNKIGWPTSLPTNEKEAFTKRVLSEKRKAFEDFVMSSNVPLRPGVESFIDDALNEELSVAILIAYSKYGENLSRFVIEKLGEKRISKVKIIGKEEVTGSFYGQLVMGKGVSSGLDEQIIMEARKAASLEKQKIAKEVASILKLSVDIDTTASESFKTVVATLRAGAECTGLPVQSCVLIAGSQSGVLGAEQIGMPCVVVRNSVTTRAEFPSAKAVMDGFGGADLTVYKLLKRKW